MAYDNSAPGPWDEPGDLSPPLGEPMRPTHHRFRLEPFASIQSNLAEEWLIKKLFPVKGVAAIFGKPGSLKSFVALDMSLHIALGWSTASSPPSPTKRPSPTSPPAAPSPNSPPKSPPGAGRPACCIGEGWARWNARTPLPCYSRGKEGRPCQTGRNTRSTAPGIMRP